MSNEARLAEEVGIGILSEDHNAHISYVESGLTSPGIPDMDVCACGHETHIELKYGYEKYPPYLRPSQYRWFKNRAISGGKSWLFAKVWDPEGHVYCLYDVYTTLKLAGRLSNEEWISTANRTWRSIDWGEFVDEVFRDS